MSEASFRCSWVFARRLDSEMKHEDVATSLDFDFEKDWLKF